MNCDAGKKPMLIHRRACETGRQFIHSKSAINDGFEIAIEINGRHICPCHVCVCRGHVCGSRGVRVDRGAVCSVTADGNTAEPGHRKAVWRISGLDIRIGGRFRTGRDGKSGNRYRGFRFIHVAAIRIDFIHCRGGHFPDSIRMRNPDCGKPCYRPFIRALARTLPLPVQSARWNLNSDPSPEFFFENRCAGKGDLALRYDSATVLEYTHFPYGHCEIRQIMLRNSFKIMQKFIRIMKYPRNPCKEQV